MKAKPPFLALLAPGKCHLLYDTFLAAVFCAATLAFADEPGKKPDACCAEPTLAAKKDAARGETVAVSLSEALAKEGAIFSSESIYQLDGQFTADNGPAFSLGELRGRPVVLSMFFASCGYACPLLVTDMLAIQGRLPAELRGQAVFVLVSFDVARDSAEVLAQYRATRGLDLSWVLLRGEDAPVRELAALLGVKFKQETDGMFAHSNLVTILNAEGEVVHQRIGLKGGLDEAATALAATFQK